jgi:hypothetical protein
VSRIPIKVMRTVKMGWVFPVSIFSLVLVLWGSTWLLLTFFMDGCDNRGTFGDMFGSVNALFSGLAFASLIYTIVLQRKELKLHQHELELTRNEMHAQMEQMQMQNLTLKKQNFEDTFFQLLRMQNDITNSIDLADAKGQIFVQGKDCFAFLYDQFRKEWKAKTAKGKNELDKINASYLIFYEAYQSEVGHYFSHLYNVIKFVDTSDSYDKKLYTNLVRAQLSSFELVMIFYSVLSEMGRDKFKPLIEKYALLKNLPRKELLDPRHVELYNSGAYG